MKPKLINITSAALVALLTIGSFTLSYNALRQVALGNGISESLSYIWPFLIDGALIVFSLAVVDAYLRSEGTIKQWVLVIVYTILTIAFNIFHAPNNPMAQVVAAIAPLSLFFSFELLMGLLKGQVVRQSKQLSIETLTASITKMTDQEITLTEQNDTLQKSVIQSKSEIKSLSKSIEAHKVTLQKLENEAVKSKSKPIKKVSKGKSSKHGTLSKEEKSKVTNELHDSGLIVSEILERMTKDGVKTSESTIRRTLNGTIKTKA